MDENKLSTYTSNPVEIAVRNQYRYTCKDKILTVEDCYSLPLTGNFGYNLDTVALELDSKRQTSFVSEPNPIIDEMLNVIQYIIEVKQTEEKHQKLEQERQDKIIRLLQLKEEKLMKSLTIDEINDKLQELQ